MHEFRKDVEGLRAVAVVAVILYHAAVPGFGGGYVGVDVFFVISGFLITGQLVRDEEPSALKRIRHFYARRVRRIVPAATLVIVATLAGAALLQSPLLQPAARDDAASAMFFFSNLRFADLATDYFNQGAAPSLFQHFWSLSVEEQFYFVWPALMVGAALLSSARQHVARLAVVSVAGLGSFALCVRFTDTDPVNAFFQLPMRAWELCAGAALALAATKVALSPDARRVARAFGLALIVVSIALLDDSSTFPGVAALAPVGGAVLVVLAGMNPRSAADAGRVLTPAPMQLLGRYSYSLYLWHWPVLMLAGLRYTPVLSDWKRAVVLMAVVTLPLAVASYHFVEHPFRTSFTRRRDGQTLGVGALILAAGAFTFVPYGLVAADAGDAGRRADPAAAAGVTPTEFVPNNLVPTLTDAHNFARTGDFRDNSITCRQGHQICVAGDRSSKTTVAIFGDSHAAHWAKAFDVVGKQNGWRVLALTHTGCRSFDEPNNDNGVCTRFRQAARAEIARERPALVVLSNQSAGYFVGDRAGWERGVRSGIAALQPHTRIAVFAQSPRAAEAVPVCLSTHVRRSAACEPVRAEPVRAALNEGLGAISAASGAGFIDIVPWMCNDARCPVIVGNVLVYRDRSHITGDFSLARVDRLGAALRALLPPAAA